MPALSENDSNIHMLWKLSWYHHPSDGHTLQTQLSSLILVYIYLQEVSITMMLYFELHGLFRLTHNIVGPRRGLSEWVMCFLRVQVSNTH